MTRPSRLAGKDRSSVTVVLIGLFVVSAAIRVISGPLPALALDVTGSDLEAILRYPERDFAAGAELLDPLVSELEARKSELVDREAALERREQEAERLSQEIAAQLAALEAAEKRLEGVLAIARTASETDVAQLVSVYEAMKPKDTARVFSEMTPDFAAGFLARMQPEIAARVVSALDPQKAYSISVVLAGRNL